MLPPFDSISRDISLEVLFCVPLKSPCSIKWEIPLFFLVSRIEPTLIKVENLTVLAPGTSSQITQGPLSIFSTYTLHIAPV